MVDKAIIVESKIKFTQMSRYAPDEVNIDEKK
jgi:hypothetical protein